MYCIFNYAQTPDDSISALKYKSNFTYSEKPHLPFQKVVKVWMTDVSKASSSHS